MLVCRKPVFTGLCLRECMPACNSSGILGGGGMVMSRDDGGERKCLAFELGEGGKATPLGTGGGGGTEM